MKKKSAESPEILFEPVEPRILFSADGAGALVADAEPMPEEPAIEATLLDNQSDNTTTQENEQDEARTEIVFIDENVEGYEQLVDDLLGNGENRNFEIRVIDGGIEEITSALQDAENINAIHIIAHGDEGEIQIGDTTITNDTFTEFNQTLTGWSDSLTEQADILFYGCNVAGSDNGQQLLGKIAAATGADIAASDDLTGNVDEGGDWILEYHHGQLETEIAFSQQARDQFQGVLDIDSNLVAHYTFDSDASDETSNNNDGSLTGNAAIDPTDSTDKIGVAKLSLDGSGDYVDLSSHASSFSGLTEGTISAWIKTTDTGESTIFGLNDIGADEEIIKFSVDNGQLKWLTFNDNGGHIIAFSNYNTLNDGNWHHVAVTVGASGHQMYIDGTAVTMDHSSGGSPTDTDFFSDMNEVDTVHIGRSLYTGSGADFGGLMDEVRVYDRPLTSSDITELYNYTGSNEAPVANNDSATTNQDTAVIIDVVANDTDAEGDSLTVVETTEPANGSVVNNGDGTVTYTPDGGYTGADSFDYKIIDSGAGLQHYYSLDGNANDAIGSNNGTIVGASTVAGEFGNALSFDEADDHVVLSDITYASDFSISFDFNIPDNTGSLFQYMYSHGNINSTNSINVFLNEASHGTDPNMFRTVIRDSNDTLDNTALQFDASSFIGTGWHTYTVTVGENGIEVFIDGVSQASDATRGTDGVNPTGSVYLGARQDLNADRRFGGSLDSVQIYNTALSSDQVSDMSSETNRGTVNVTVNAVNNAPVNTVPSTQITNEDTTLVFNAANSNLISITDEAGTNLSVTLEVTNGSLSLSQTTGLTFEAGANGTSTMTITGTVENINTALDGLQYDATSDYNGSDTLTLTTTDGTIYTLNVDANLQGYYEFSNSNPGNDSSPGSTNGGTLNGDASIISDPERGDVLSLDGDSDYVEISGTFSNPANVTLAAWVNTSASGEQTVISLGDSLGLRVDNQTVDGFYYDGSNWNGVGDGGSLNSGWNHIALTFDDTNNTMTTYLNGVAVGTQVVSGSISYTLGSNAIIGGHGATPTTWETTGLIDDARIYDRALSSAEISALVNAPAQPTDIDTVGITVNAVNDAAVVSSTEGTSLSYIENDGAVSITSTLSISDVDDTNLESAVIQITGNYVNGEDVLSFTDQNGISGSWNASTGTLTLSGTSSVANYQAALRSIAYTNTSEDPNTATRTVSFTVNDGDVDSNTQTRDIAVTSAIDLSQTVPGAQSINEDTTLTFSTGNGNAVSVSDGVSTTNTLLQVTLSANDGVLNLSQTTGITFVTGSQGSGSFVIEGTESALNAAFEGMTFTPDSNFNGAVTLNMQTAVAADLEGHYTFEGGNANDQSAGTINNGTFNGNATTTIDGTRGEVLSLDGVSDSVTVNGLFGEPTDVTLAAWVDVTTGVENGEVISLGDSFALRVDGVGGGLTAFYYDGSTWNFASAPNTNLDGAGWNHIAATFDDTNNQIQLFLNGKLVHTEAATGSITYNQGANTIIGGHGNSSTAFDFQGKIDDARIFDRALTASEIQALAADQSTTSNDTVAITVNSVNDAPEFTRETEIDFNSYSIGNLNGQNGWTTESFNTGDSLAVTSGTGPDGSNAITFGAVGPGAGSSASLVGESAIPDLQNTSTLSVEWSAKNSWWGGEFGIAADENSDGQILRSGDEIALKVKVDDVNSRVTVTLPDGSTTNFTHSFGSGHWVDFRWEIDLTANAGQGSATLYFRNATLGETNWQTDAATTSINLGLNTSANDKTNPVNWDSIYIHAEGGGNGFDRFHTVVDSPSGSADFTEGGLAVVLDPNIKIFDQELTPTDQLSGTVLTLNRNGGANADDVFSATGNLSFSAGNAFLGAKNVGIYSQVDGLLTIQFGNFGPGVTQAEVNEVLQSIAYANNNDDPPASVQIDWTFNDGNVGAQGSGGAQQVIGSTTVNITPSNDAPTDLHYTQFIGGSEFIVNSTTANDQDEPEVATLANGDFVVVWESTNQDGDEDGIYFQRFNSNGVAQGSETQVNVTTTDDQDDPQIVALSNGSFAIVWESTNQDGSAHGIYGRIYDASGTATTGEILINTTTTDNQIDPDVTALNGGGFVVVWESDNQDGDQDGIYSQRFDNAGVAQGSETLVNTTTTGGQFDPLVTSLNDGGYVVTWDSDASGSTEVMAQRFDASGVKVGSEIQVNTFTSGIQDDAPAAALSGGGFVVVWESAGQDGDGEGLFAQLFDASGNTVGSEFQVNTSIASSQLDVEVIALEDGGFVAAWQSDGGQDGDMSGVYAQQFDASGNKVNGEFQINVTTANAQSDPSLTLLQDGRLLVVYESFGQDGSNDAVVGRIFNPTLNENSPNGTVVAIASQTVDPDDSSGFTYSLTNDAGGAFTINSSDGTITVADTSLIDFETASSMSVTVRVQDGSGGTHDEVVTITIKDVNEAATITNLSGDTLAYTEGDGAQVIEQSTDALVNDVDSSNFDTGTLTVSFTAGSDAAEDVLSIRNQGTGAGQIGVSGSNVTYAGTVIGTFTGGSSGTDLVITLNANADATAVSALIQNITYENTDTDDPTASTRTVTYVLTDGDGGTSANYDTTVTVLKVNDQAIVDLNGADGGGTNYSTTFTEGAGAVNVTDTDATVSDADNTTYDSLDLNLSGFVDGSNEKITIGGYTFSIGTAETVTRTVGSTDFEIDFDGGGFNIQEELSGSFPEADLQTLIRGITYENLSDNPSTTNRTIDFIARDGNALLGLTSTSTISMVAVNDEQVLATNTGATVAEGSTGNTVTTAMLHTTDLDNTDAQLVYTVDVVPSNGTLYNNGTALNATDTFTQADIDAGLITYDHDGSQTSSDTFDFTVDDGAGSTTSSTFNWTVTNINDASVVSNIEGTNLAYTENDGAVAITSNLTLSDVDDTDLESAVIQITGNYVNGEDVLNFTNQNGISGSWNASTGTLTLTGTSSLSNYESAIRSITYTNNSEDPSTATRTVSFTVNDGDTNSNTQSRNITVTRVNDAPTGSDNTVTTNEDTDFVFSSSDFGFNDIDGDNFEYLNIASGPSNGTLYYDADSDGVVDAGETVGASDSIEKSDIDAGYLKFKAANDSNGTGYDSFTFAVQDDAGTMNGGQDTDQTPNTMTIDVTAVNDEEVLATNTGTTVAEGSTGNTVTTAMLHTTDIDNTDAQLVYTVDVAPGNGTLYNNGTVLNATDTFTQADIDAGLITYDHDGSQTSSDSFDFTVDDGQGTTTSSTFNWTVTNVNDAPVNTVPGAQTVNEDTSLNITGISVNDVDGNLATTQLTVSNGDLTVSLAGGATISSGANGSNTLTLSGTQTQINAALATLSYQGNLNFNGSDTLTVLSTDSDGTPLSDSDNVAITVNAVNDAPVNTTPISVSTNEDTTINFTGANQIQISDVDDNGSNVRVQLNVGVGGLMTLGDTTGLSFSAGDGSADANMVFTGTVANINAALLTLSFTPTADFNGSVNMTIITNDLGNTGADPGLTGDGSSEQDSDTFSIIVNAVDDTPTLNNNSLTLLEGETVTLNSTMLSATDPDDTDANLIFNVSSVTGGHFAVATTPQTIITSFTQNQVTAGQIIFVHNGGEAAPSYDVSVTDGNTASSPAAAAISFTNVNDQPLITSLGGDSISIPNDGTRYLIDVAASADLQDPDSPTDYGGATLTVTGNNFQVSDQLAIDTSGTIVLSSSSPGTMQIDIAGTHIANATGITSSGMTITFNGNATDADIDTLLQSFTFDTTSTTLGSRSVDFVFNDGDGTANGGVDTSPTATVNIAVASATDGLVTTNEDTTYTYTASDFDFTGITGTDLTSITITSLPSEGTLFLNGTPVTINQQISKADIDAGLFQFTPDADENGALYASFDFYVNTGKPSVTVLAGEPNSFTLGGGSLLATDQILADSDNFGLGGTYSSSVVVSATNSTIDASYLSQGQVLFNGFVPDANWTAAELTALDTWIQAGGILISNSDSASYDSVSNFYGLTIGGTASSTWQVDDASSPIMNGPFGLVGNNGDNFSAAGTISYFDSASLGPGDQVIAVDSVSGEPTMVLRQHGSGHILFTSDEGIFRAGMTGGGTISTPNDMIAANVFAWALEQAPVTTTHTMNIDVNAVNDDPINTGTLPSDISVTEDVSSNVDLSAINFYDVDSATGSLTVTLTTGSGGTLSAVSGGGVTIGGSGTGSVTLTGTQGDLNTFFNSASNIQYLSALNVSGNNADTIQVTVNDNGNIGSGGGADQNFGTVNVDIIAVNDAAVVNMNTAALNFTEQNPIGIDVGLTITDVDDTHLEGATIRFTAGYENGVDSFNWTPHLGIGGIWNAATGTLTFTGTATVADYQSLLRTVTFVNNSDNPDTTTRTFEVTVNDGDTDSAAVSRNILINLVNDEQVLATNTGTTVAEGSTGNTVTTAMLHTTDVDNTDAQLVYTVDVAPSNGTLYNNGTALNATDTFTQADIDAGLITYDHDGSQTSSDSFDFTVDDGQGSTTSSTFNWTVTNVNDASVVSNIEGPDLAYTENDGAVAITSTITLSDVDDTDLESAVIQITGNYVNGEDVLSFTNQNGISGSWNASTGTLTLTGTSSLSNYESAIRSITYTNNSEDPSIATRTVSFTVNDGDIDSNTQTRDITIASVNDEQVLATNTGTTVNEGSTGNTITTAMLHATDVDNSDAQLVYTITGTPAYGTLYNNGVVMGLSDTFTQADIDAGLITFNHDGSETTTDDFDFSVDDGAGTATTGTFNFTITPINDPPVANNDSATVDEGNSVNINLATNDTDVDNAIDLTSIQIVAGPSNGSVIVNTDGTVDYTHNGSETISDSFTYTIRDASGQVSNVATVNLTINPVNDAPTAVNDSATVNEGAAITINVAGNDNDPEGSLDLTSIQIIGTPSNGVLIDNNDGTLDYFHDGSETTSDSFSYTIRDTSGLVSNIATVNITVNPVNDAPTIMQNELTYESGTTVHMDASSILATDVDNIDSTLVFTASVVTGGQFEEVANPGVAITNFTQGQINNGDIQFVHFGGVAPYYELTVFDGALIDGPEAVTVFQIIPTDDPDNPIILEIDTTPGDDGDTEITGITISVDGSDDKTLEISLKRPIISSSTPDFIEGKPVDFVVEELTKEAIVVSNDSQYLEDFGHSFTERLLKHFAELKHQAVELSEALGFADRDSRNVESNFEQALTEFRREMDMTNEASQNTYEFAANVGKVMGLGLSVGSLTWLLRVEWLFSVMLSSVPAWKSFDPLPVLAATGKRKVDAELSDKEREELRRIEEQDREAERNATMIFDSIDSATSSDKA